MGISKILYDFKHVIWELVILLQLSPAYGHPNWGLHSKDIFAVFGFVEKQKKIEDWTCFISSKMIDQKNPFYNDLKQDFPQFKCNHRLLFHWGYNAKPWSHELEVKVRECAIKMNLDEEQLIAIFLERTREEQKRRNRLMIEETNHCFQLNGDRKLIRFLTAMAYNIHILGDYTSEDNSDLTGLQDFDDLIGQIVIELRTIDDQGSKKFIKGITSLHKKKFLSVQLKADAMMAYLKSQMPIFIQTARQGRLRRILESKGVQFIKIKTQLEIILNKLHLL